MRNDSRLTTGRSVRSRFYSDSISARLFNIFPWEEREKIFFARRTLQPRCFVETPRAFVFRETRPSFPSRASPPHFPILHDERGKPSSGKGRRERALSNFHAGRHRRHFGDARYISPRLNINDNANPADFKCRALFFRRDPILLDAP